ncbi:MAG: metal-dependent transcriptional regulator [Opitutales bacterium]|nr:metal-dependent transcriptional regulator [Opitutales bacterium]NRA26584.1 metal-dependent transcriptional regulator [Opitutales bacterium]
MPSTTVENYLKQIFLIARKSSDQVASMGAVAQAMEVVPGTATTMAKSLAESGLALYTPRVGITLTAEGQKIAIKMLRRHRLIEYFLVETLGMDWSEIHEEAEHLEHAISDRVLEYIDKFLGHPTTDPHGDVIPSAEGEFHFRKIEPLSEVGEGEAFVIAQLIDQDSKFLRFAESNQLVPSTNMRLIQRDEMAACLILQFAKSERKITLGIPAAQKILVER